MITWYIVALYFFKIAWSDHVNRARVDDWTRVLKITNIMHDAVEHSSWFRAIK